MPTLHAKPLPMSQGLPVALFSQTRDLLEDPNFWPLPRISRVLRPNPVWAACLRSLSGQCHTDTARVLVQRGPNAKPPWPFPATPSVSMGTAAQPVYLS